MSAGCLGKHHHDLIVTMSQNERHRSIKEILILHLGYSKGNGMQITYNELIGSLYEQKSLL
jgi:hypothetical protein